MEKWEIMAGGSATALGSGLWPGSYGKVSLPEYIFIDIGCGGRL